MFIFTFFEQYVFTNIKFGFGYNSADFIYISDIMYYIFI